MKRAPFDAGSVAATLATTYRFDEQAAIYLDSIAFQEEEAARSPWHIRRDLGLACDIASRYHDPADALRLLDKAMGPYLRRQESSTTNGMQSLNCTELSIVLSGTPLALKGLETRIGEYLLGDGIRWPPMPPLLPPVAGPLDDDPNPWQENAIRDLEGD